VTPHEPLSSEQAKIEAKIEAVAPAAISHRYAIYALIVIAGANFLSYMDRQVVSGLEKELTEAFNLDEADFGKLWTAFTVGYMVFAPVIGFFVQRQNRPRIFGVCVFVWSLATMWSGIASSRHELFAARFLIGIGEAGCLVIGPTLISEYFSKEARGKALSIFFLGLPLGGTAGYAVASEVPKHFGTWRDAFYFAGLPGLGLAVLVFLLIDPPRGGESAGAHGHEHVPFRGFKPYLELLKNRTLLLIILAQAFAVIILVPLLHFGVRFLQDKFSMEKSAATLSIGSIALVAGSLGNLLSGQIGDRLARRVKGAYALLAGVAYIVGAPLLIIGFTTTSKPIMLISLGAGAFCFFLCMPAVNTQIANSVSFGRRAMAFAMAVFILHLLGDTFAPILFGKVDNLMGERLHGAALVASTVGLTAPPAGQGPFLAASSLLTQRSNAVHGRQNAFVLFSCSLFAAGICSLLAMRTARKDEELADKKLDPLKGTDASGDGMVPSSDSRDTNIRASDPRVQ
jgi:predicted MFS family arabinose efflux permease